MRSSGSLAITWPRVGQIRELGNEAVSVAVGRDEDSVGFECFDILDLVVLTDLGSCRHGPSGETTDEARRLDRAVAGMGDRTVEAPGRSPGDVV
jgi:hypothetical protein